MTEVVQRYLIREGYKVSVAADVRSALKEAHGGRIWAQSAPGEGARSSFVLPKATA